MAVACRVLVQSIRMDVVRDVDLIVWFRSGLMVVQRLDVGRIEVPSGSRVEGRGRVLSVE